MNWFQGQLIDLNLITQKNCKLIKSKERLIYKANDVFITSSLIIRTDLSCIRIDQSDKLRTGKEILHNVIRLQMNNSSEHLRFFLKYMNDNKKLSDSNILILYDHEKFIKLLFLLVIYIPKLIDYIVNLENNIVLYDTGIRNSYRVFVPWEFFSLLFEIIESYSGNKESRKLISDILLLNNYINYRDYFKHYE